MKFFSAFLLLLTFGCGHNEMVEKTLQNEQIAFSIAVSDRAEIDRRGNSFIIIENNIPFVVRLMYSQSQAAMLGELDEIRKNIYDQWGHSNADGEELSVKERVTAGNWSGQEISRRRGPEITQYWFLNNDCYGVVIGIVCQDYQSDANQALARAMVESINIIEPAITEMNNENKINFTLLDKNWEIVLPAEMKFLIEDDYFTIWLSDKQNAYIHFTENQEKYVHDNQAMLKELKKVIGLNKIITSGATINGWTVSTYCDNPDAMKNYVSIASRGKLMLMFVAVANEDTVFSAEDEAFFDHIWNQVQIQARP